MVPPKRQPFYWRAFVTFYVVISSALGLAILVLTLGSVPPFGTVMTVGESLKNSWATSATEPPVPHAELWTLAKLAETTKVPLDQALGNLKQAGLTPASPDVTLADLAAQAHMTPQVVYQAAVGSANTAPIPLAEGGGYGRKTVLEICGQINVPLATGLDRLRQRGIDATAGSNVRELAASARTSPMDIVKLLQG